MKDYIRKKPLVDKSAFIACNTILKGSVKIGRYSSIWYGSIIRGDINKITIGDYTNIQDGCILHVADKYDIIIGNYVTIGHNVNLHGCIIEDNVLVGIGAIILNGAVLKKGCQVGAGALVTENMVVEENSLVLGMPAKIVRRLINTEIRANTEMAKKYSKLIKFYKTENKEIYPHTN